MRKFTLFFASLLVAIGAMAQTTTIDVTKTYTLECQSGYAHSTTRFIGVTDAGVIDGQSATAAEVKFEEAEEGSYYIKVGDKYINHDGTAISAGDAATTAWILGTVGNLVTFKVPNTTFYLNNNGSDCTDGTVTNLKGNNHPNGPTASNACSTWALVAPEDIVDVVDEDAIKAELTDKLIISLGEAATSIETEQWYVLYNQARGCYVSEESSSFIMRGTSSLTIPVDAIEKAGYLYKFISTGNDNEYYIMSGNGLYFKINQGGSTVSTTPVAYTIAQIGDNAGHFYGQMVSDSRVLDGNGEGGKLAGWDTTVPTATGGNNDYQFLPATLEEDGLKALIAVIEAANIVAGENIGDYTSEYATAVAEAIATANEKIEAGTAEDSDIEALQAVYDNVSVVLPDPNKFYYFDCTYKGDEEEISRKLHINANNQLNWVSTQSAFDAAGSRAIFQFEAGSKGNTVKIKSVHTQSYMGEISGNITFGETGAEITIAKSKQNNQAVVFTTDGSTGIHANASPVIAWTNEAGSNHYILTEVESFKHTLTVGEVGYSTLMLGFNATIPAGVECYYAAEAIDENGVLNLTKVEGTLPANTAVIVKLADGQAAGNFDFAYTDATATVSGNLLSGTLYTKNVPATAAYVLSAPEGKVGLYKATLTEGAFQNNANKAYFANGSNNIVSYSFNFDWAGTTGIEGVTAEGAQDGAIYDITGRRVKAITAPGIYIVNGKKVVK